MDNEENVCGLDLSYRSIGEKIKDFILGFHECSPGQIYFQNTMAYGNVIQRVCHIHSLTI